MNTKKQIPSYQNSLQRLRENLGGMLPEAALKVFDYDAQSLQSQQHSILQLNTGDKAPGFTLSNTVNQAIKLSELLKKGKVVLIFYRGVWCPYCNLQLFQYQSVLSKIKSLGAQLVAISPQTPDASLSIKEKNELGFEVLSDNGNIVARNYTKVFRNKDAPVDAMTALGFDFGSHYSDDSRELPVPAVFIIDSDSTISFAKSLGGDYRNRVEVSEIIDSLKKS
ncbi:peroxiredoxin-like family protein [Aquimarina sp. RZ0]|uniref:peroxiredoxin-like family protein n=1 Tax=Aquimarina sp. RZ0 TaxID=2607730 RepID=UPI0011F21119|nr:peroxiredoxin-like family protein [Aquimarina sp. RZ0]KAA1246238.1 AhpC/TSA family protein [Aquimarina sp. RZ0]